MSKLLKSLEQPAKIALQTYTLEHGIERLSVAIPLVKVPEFERRFAALTERTKPNVIQLVESVGGKIR